MSLLVLCCLTLRPSLSPHHPSSFHPSCSGFLTLRFLPRHPPGQLHTRAPPPPTPCYPPPHPPSPQGEPTARSPFVLPSSSSLLHLLCVREASKGSEERKAAKEEAGARNQTGEQTGAVLTQRVESFRKPRFQWFSDKQKCTTEI